MKSTGVQKITVSFRVPLEIRRQMEEKAERLGVRLSEVCENALIEGIQDAPGTEENEGNGILTPVDFENLSNLFEDLLRENGSVQNENEESTLNKGENLLLPSGLTVRIDNEKSESIKEYIDSCIAYAESKGVTISESELLTKMLLFTIKKKPQNQDFADDSLFPEYIFKFKG